MFNIKKCISINTACLLLTAIKSPQCRFIGLDGTQNTIELPENSTAHTLLATIRARDGINGMLVHGTDILSPIAPLDPRETYTLILPNHLERFKIVLEQRINGIAGLDQLARQRVIQAINSIDSRPSQTIQRDTWTLSSELTLHIFPQYHGDWCSISQLTLRPLEIIFSSSDSNAIIAALSNLGIMVPRILFSGFCSFSNINYNAT